jgi:hypothetical protein
MLERAPQPLSEVDREAIERHLETGHLSSHDAAEVSEEDVRKLIAAEEYWREAVRASEPREYYGSQDSLRCYWCQRDWNSCEDFKDPERHEADCVWKRAQR